MSYRFGLCRLMLLRHATAVTTQLYKTPRITLNVVQKRYKSGLQPLSDFTGKPSMFSMEKVKKYYETIPLLVISAIGVVCEVLFLVRHLFTRDDIRFCPKGGKMAFEKFEEIEKGDKPKIRKFRVINQKYEYTDELVDALHALREPTEEEKAAIEAQRKKQKK